MADEEDDDDADKNSSKIHFVICLAVPVCPNVGVLDSLKGGSRKIELEN